MNAPQPYRLAAGGEIDRSRPLEFTCNGKPYAGFAGDTLASALLANGVRIVGRSFKRHRPRGVLSAGAEETNALFRVDAGRTSIPLVRATLQPLLAGLAATTENAYPSVDFDLGRILDYTHALWPAGFYNKTFKWPSWHWYEGAIRRSAGLGRLPAGEDATQYFQHNRHCDVLVVGGGPAGLGAALAAARSGVRVVLVEQHARLGGRLLAERLEIDGAPAVRWVETVAAELASLANVTVLTSTMAAGCYDHGVVTAIDRTHAHDPNSPAERIWKLRAKQLVLATGAIEQPLVFANNDRPGILLAGAVREYLHRYAVTPGRSVVVATNNDDAYHTAFALDDAGVAVPAIVDARAQAGAAVAAEAGRRGLTVAANAVIVDTAGTRGVRRVTVGTLTVDGRGLDGAARSVDCDAVAMSGGWSPNVHLYSTAGGKLRYEEGLACFVPDRRRAGVRIAGAANGDFALGDAIARGAAAGGSAARDAGATAPLALVLVGATSPWSYGIRRLAGPPGGDSGNQWVDFLHDVTVADIELAVRENFVAVEHLKRYTTTGMSIDQGKTSNLNALMLLAELTDRPVHEVGTTTFRPMYSPVAMGTLAGGTHGNLYAPARLMPAHAWHVAHGAEMEDYGGWKRPALYHRAGTTREQAIALEVLAVRNKVGLFEGSPLGKIEVRGPDAAEFLNRIYVNNALTLKPGKVRYGLMLSENGIVIDDGVFACLGPDHYLINTTSGGADRIAGWLDEWHQCEWPDLRVVLLPVTTQWAVISVVGPQARALLARLESDIDFDPKDFPHMSLRTGRYAGLPARVQRVSFSGELSYEVAVPARQGEALWQRLFAAGADLGIEPVGIEAWMVLRTEKGFLHVGGDTDGTTNPYDIGFGRIIDNKTGDFVGRRSLQRARDRQPDRRQFVGLEPVNPDDRLVAGAHLVREQGGKRRTEGFVTSACLSPVLGRSIGLGLLEGGFGRKGEVVTVFDDGRTFQARVVEPAFYDPAGERMHG